VGDLNTLHSCFNCIGWEYSSVQKVIKACGAFLCSVWKCL